MVLWYSYVPVCTYICFMFPANNAYVHTYVQHLFIHISYIPYVNYDFFRRGGMISVRFYDVSESFDR